MATKRIPYLDTIKGILIILVIIGHAIQFSYPEDYEQLFSFRFIYSFHMPLFFFVSGYLANRGKYVGNVILKRAYQLLLPFLFWAFVDPLINQGAISLDTTLLTIMYPDRGLWFLYNLFVYSAIFNISEYVEEKVKLKHYVTFIFFLGVLYALMLVFHIKFNCQQLCYHIPFYAFGYYYKRSKLDCAKPLYIILLIGCGYALFVPFWTTNGNPLFYEWLNLGSGVAYVYRYAVQFVGALLFFEMARKFIHKDFHIINLIGASTLGIYTLQFSVLRYLIKLIELDNTVLEVIVVSVFALPICYMLVYLIRKVPYLRLLLIGEK